MYNGEQVRPKSELGSRLAVVIAVLLVAAPIIVILGMCIAYLVTPFLPPKAKDTGTQDAPTPTPTPLETKPRHELLGIKERTVIGCLVSLDVWVSGVVSKFIKLIKKGLDLF